MFKEKIQELQQSKKKVVVFSQFTKMLKKMKVWADKKGYKTFYLDGDTRDRQGIVNDFEEIREGIFFISLKAGGVGLNIVSCQYAIIYDPWWNPAIESQAEDRLYRIGQKKDVYIYKLVTENSIEEKIELLKEKKAALFNQLFEDTSLVEPIKISELKKLLSS